ncbi:MAG: hypothetical protein HWN66_04530 [Candidatus Helarchaeota archaeon]|nr:hypothetical protein [Candidatus Helarchaeota archaeon]
MAHSTRIGNIEELFKSKVSDIVARRSLPDVVGFLVNKRGPEQAEKDLRDIARIITERMLMVWKPKGRKPFNLFKEMMNLFFGNKKVKGRVIERMNKRPTKIVIRDFNCPICPEKTKEDLEVPEIHYCTPVSGFVETMIKHLMNQDIVPYTKVTCNTVASVGSGDKYCEHIIDLEYGGF